MAFPVALGLLADGLALGFGSLAMGDAMGLFADSNALRAVEQLAAFVRALNLTLRLLAFDVANSVFGFSTGSMALGRLTYRVADGRAVRVVALPGTLRVALSFRHEFGAA